MKILVIMEKSNRELMKTKIHLTYPSVVKNLMLVFTIIKKVLSDGVPALYVQGQQLHHEDLVIIRPRQCCKIRASIRKIPGAKS